MGPKSICKNCMRKATKLKWFHLNRRAVNLLWLCESPETAPNLRQRLLASIVSSLTLPYRTSFRPIKLDFSVTCTLLSY